METGSDLSHVFDVSVRYSGEWECQMQNGKRVSDADKAANLQEIAEDVLRHLHNGGHTGVKDAGFRDRISRLVLEHAGAGPFDGAVIAASVLKAIGSSPASAKSCFHAEGSAHFT